MKIESEFDLIEALAAKEAAKRLSFILDEAELIAAKLKYHGLESVSYTHLTLPTKRIV